MFFVYLFAAVAGGLLVLIALLGGGHHEAGTDAGGMVLDDASAAHPGAGVSADGGASAGHHEHAGGEGVPSGLGVALGWLGSVQLWTYLLAFGGLTGLLLRSVAGVAEPLAGGAALAVGLGSGLLARAVLRRVVGSGQSGTTSHERLVGSSAQVLIPAAAGGTGKIRLTASGHMLDLLARTSDGGALPEGAMVSILDVRDGIAEVLREDEPPARRAAPAAAATAAPLPTGPASLPKG